MFNFKAFSKTAKDLGGVSVSIIGAFNVLAAMECILTGKSSLYNSGFMTTLIKSAAITTVASATMSGILADKEKEPKQVAYEKSMQLSYHLQDCGYLDADKRAGIIEIANEFFLDILNFDDESTDPSLTYLNKSLDLIKANNLEAFESLTKKVDKFIKKTSAK